MKLDFKAANATIAGQIETICRKYLPRGRRQGDWYLACVPWREDKTPSLGVSMTTGNWKDFGRAGEYGDALDLLSRLTRRKAVDIVRDLQGTDD